MVLPVDLETLGSLGDAERVYLTDGAGRTVARMTVSERFTWDRKEVARHVFGTTEERHPGVASLCRQPETMIGGPIEVLSESRDQIRAHHMTPGQSRSWFSGRGWSRICAFQTRNIPHAGHEYLQKVALAICDGLMIQPVIGKKKSGDFRDDVIIAAYRTFIENYFPRERVLLNILPFDMRYAGPKEAIFHAIVRKNYGCSHMIVGRDHAGVGGFYPPEAAIEIFEQFPDLGVTPVTVRGDFFHCRQCGSIASERTCPHDRDQHISFSGTEIRALLQQGKSAPAEILRPEVFAVLQKHNEVFVE
jgi:sulfate adenylyltransferase